MPAEPDHTALDRPWVAWFTDLPTKRPELLEGFGELFQDFVRNVVDANERYDREDRRVGLIHMLTAIEAFFADITKIQPPDTYPMNHLAFPAQMLVEVLEALTPAESERFLHHQIIRRIERAVAAGTVQCLVETGWKLNRATEFVAARIKVPVETLGSWRDAILKTEVGKSPRQDPRPHIRAFYDMAAAVDRDNPAAVMTLVEHQLHLFFPPNRKHDVERRGAKPKAKVKLVRPRKVPA
jgi:hypothetical protein